MAAPKVSLGPADCYFRPPLSTPTPNPRPPPRPPPPPQAPLILDVAVNGRQIVERNVRLYIDNGGDTEDVQVPLFDPADGANPGYWWLDTQLRPGVDAMHASLKLHGVDVLYKVFPGGRHNERAWGQRVELPLRHLLGKPEAR